MRNQCPACRHVNAAASRRCAACGVDLLEARADAGPERPASPLSSGAIWLDQLDDLAPASTPVELTLRDLGTAVEGQNGASETAVPLRPAPPPAVRSFTLPSVAWPSPEPLLKPALPTPVAAPPLAAAPNPATLKTAKRAAVRRERLAAARPSLPAAGGAASDVLVIEADVPARDLLCGLLRGFGFVVHAAAEAAVALDWARVHRVAAVFADLPPDPARADATLTLFKTVRTVERRDGGAPAVLTVVADQLRPVERVRAELAGCDGVIAKPVTRGSVARMLDERGVRLPSDERRR